MVKALVERVEESAKWVEEKRKGVGFGPWRLGEVEKWKEGIRRRVEEESPLGKYVKVLRKTREKRKKLLEKVCVFFLPSVLECFFRFRLLSADVFMFYRREMVRTRFSKIRSFSISMHSFLS